MLWQSQCPRIALAYLSGGSLKLRNWSENSEASYNAWASSSERRCSRLYIKRRNRGRGLVQLMSTYSCFSVNLSDYIEQGKDRFCRLVKKHEAGKAKYSLLKEAKALKNKAQLREGENRRTAGKTFCWQRSKLCLVKKCRTQRRN